MNLTYPTLAKWILATATGWGVLLCSVAMADPEAIHTILKKHLPLQEDVTGRGYKLIGAIKEHEGQKPKIWDDDLKQVKGLTGTQLLEEVHDLVNKRIHYQDDPFNDWLPPVVSYRDGGDCEDYAIAKLLLLRESGFPEEELRVVTLAPVRLNSPFHVILVAQLENQVYVLDSPGRAQSKDIVKLDNYRDGDRPVMWGGWSGGFAFSSTTLSRSATASGYSGLLVPRRSPLARLIGGEDRLVLVAADLKVITRRERRLNESEINKLRLLRAYYHDPTSENARRITTGEARKLDSFRKLRAKKY